MKVILRKFSAFIVSSSLFVGIPLFSWGITEFDIYFMEPSRLYYTIIALFINLLSAIILPAEGRSFGKGEKYQKKHKISLIFLQIFPLLIVIISPYLDYNRIFEISKFEFSRELGVIFFSVGYLLMNWSVFILGKQYSIDVTIQKEHQLIQNGPYRYIRHPRYLGIILSFIGIAFVFNSLISILLNIIIIIVLLWRINDEEKLLINEFPKEWLNYKVNSKKLIPFIY